MNLDHITQSPDTMDGKACIRSLPITVGAIVRKVATGRTAAQTIEEFPGLEEGDIRQALQFAAQLADELERFREKCAAVFPKEARQNKNLGSFRDSTKIGTTLAPTDDDLDALFDIVAAARAEAKTGGGLSLEEHRKRNAKRLATLSAQSYQLSRQTTSVPGNSTGVTRRIYPGSSRV